MLYIITSNILVFTLAYILECVFPLCYLFLIYKAFKLGIKLKSESFFENKIIEYIYAIILIILMEFIWIYPAIASQLNLNISDYVGEAYAILWIIGMICVGYIVVNDIFDTTTWIIAWVGIGVFIGFVTGMWSGISSGGTHGIILGFARGGISAIIEGIIFGIIAFVLLMIFYVVCGILKDYMVEKSEEIAEIIDIKKIAESKYNEALNHLANGKIGECLKYANQALNLLKNYNYNEKDENSKPYLDTKLANKIISLKDSLELLQKMEGYYYSKKYNELLKTYEEIMSKNLDSDLNEILKEKYDEIKEEYENQFNKELETGDNLFRRKKLNQAMDYYRKMLNNYPMFKDVLNSKIETCENEILNNKFIKELQKADELFKNNEIEEAMDEYEKLLNSLSGKYQKISYKYEKVLKDKIQKCKKALFTRKIQKADELFKENEIEKALSEYEHLQRLLNNTYEELSSDFEYEIKDKIQKCKEILKNPPLELFIERAKKYESEGYSEYHKNNISKAIELWKMAVEQYKGGLKIEKVKGSKKYVPIIEYFISELINKILNGEIELIKKELGWEE